MSEIKIEISASSVAWYGAITATIALLIDGVRLWLDRRRVKLKILPNMICTVPIFPNDSEDEIYTIFRVINLGIRPVTITHHGLSLIKGDGAYKELYITPGIQHIGGLPKEILEGQSYDLYSSQRALKDKTKNFTDIKFFYVTSATGAIYKKKMDGKLKKAFKEMDKEPVTK